MKGLHVRSRGDRRTLRAPMITRRREKDNGRAIGGEETNRYDGRLITALITDVHVPSP